MQSSMQRRGSRIYAMLKLPRETVRWEWEGCWSRRKWTKRTSYDSIKNSAMNSHNLYHMELQNNRGALRTSRGKPGSMAGPCTGFRSKGTNQSHFAGLFWICLLNHWLFTFSFYYYSLFFWILSSYLSHGILLCVWVAYNKQHEHLITWIIKYFRLARWFLFLHKLN